jgi:hypothetical protein
MPSDGHTHGREGPALGIVADDSSTILAGAMPLARLDRSASFSGKDGQRRSKLSEHALARELRRSHDQRVGWIVRYYRIIFDRIGHSINSMNNIALGTGT